MKKNSVPEAMAAVLFFDSVSMSMSVRPMEFKNVSKVVVIGKMVDNVVGVCQVSCQVPEL